MGDSFRVEVAVQGEAMRPGSDGERRNRNRYPFFRTVHYGQDGHTYRGLLQNLSLGGVRILCHGGGPVGQRIWLSLPGSFRHSRVEERIQGEIVWSRGSATGVQFMDMSSRCAHGIDDVLSAYPDHASPSEVSLYQAMYGTSESQRESVSAGESSARGRTLYVPRP
jgi:hypothetical protein